MPKSSQSPEIRKYKRKFNGEILCGALWGVNLLVGTDNGLLLLDRSGHGKGLSLSLVGCMALFPPSLCSVSSDLAAKVCTDGGVGGTECSGVYQWT